MFGQKVEYVAADSSLRMYDMLKSNEADLALTLLNWRIGLLAAGTLTVTDPYPDRDPNPNPPTKTQTLPLPIPLPLTLTLTLALRDPRT